MIEDLEESEAKAGKLESRQALEIMREVDEHMMAADEGFHLDREFCLLDVTHFFVLQQGWKKVQKIAGNHFD